MEDVRETEIKALAEKSLTVPKEVRLIGKDGIVQIPAVPDQFYLSEVANWLSYAKEFAPKNLRKDADFVIESINYKPVKNLSLELLESKPGIYPQKNMGGVTLVELYSPLSGRQISILELVGEDVNHSYSHHRFLSKIIRKLYENHNAFISILSQKFEMPMRGGTHYYNDALELLRKVSKELLELEEKGHCYIIPELYALRDHGLLMASDLNEVFKYEVEELGLLYSYGFSKDTSYEFLKILQTFLLKQITKFEALLSKSATGSFKDAPEILNESKWMIVPTDTKGKVKAIRKVLKLFEDDSEDSKLRIDPFQIMILLRALQGNGIIKNKIDKFQFALAYQILTGGSASYFEKQYTTDELTTANLKKICKPKQSKKVREQIKLLKELLGNDVVDFLSNLERIAQPTG